MATNIILKVDKSSVHGYGVFAMQNILEGTMVLESPYIETTGCKGEIEKYYFSHPEGQGRTILPLDRGALINSSDKPNLRCQVIDDKVTFTALVNIKQDEELFHTYNFKQDNNN